MKIEDIKVGSVMVRNGKDGTGIGIARDSKEGNEYAIFRVVGSVLFWRDDKNDQCSATIDSVSNFFYLKETSTLDFTKPIKTKGGAEVVIKFTDGRGAYPVRGYLGDSDILSSWTATGQFNTSRKGVNDLVNVKERIVKEAFINIYKSDDGFYVGGSYTSAEDAAKGAGTAVVSRAKVTIDIEEGDFQ